MPASSWRPACPGRAGRPGAHPHEPSHGDELPPRRSESRRGTDGRERALQTRPGKMGRSSHIGPLACCA